MGGSMRSGMTQPSKTKEKTMTKKRSYSYGTYYDKWTIRKGCPDALKGKPIDVIARHGWANPPKLTPAERTKRAKQDKIIIKAFYNAASNDPYTMILNALAKD